MKFKTPTIIKKNFQLLLNSKTETILILIGPLLLIGLIGAAMHDTSIKNVKAGIYSEDSSPESQMQIMTKLYTQGIIGITYDNLDKCISDVRDGKTQICLEFPEEKINQIGIINQEIILHVDFSKQRTVWNIVGKIQSVVDEETKKYQEAMMRKIQLKMIKINQETAALKDIIDQTNQQIYLMESLLDQKDDQIKQIALNIKDAQNEIEKIAKSIYELENNLLESEIPIELFQNEISNMIESINLINSYLNMAYAQISTVSLSPLIDTIMEIKEKINELETQVIKISQLTNQVNYDNLNDALNPIKLSTQSITSSSSKTISSNLKFLDYLFPSFLIFFILFNAITFSATKRIKERKSSAYIRNSISQAKARSFIIADLITSIFIISIQIFFIILIASFFLNISIIENLNSIIASILLSVSIFSLIGILIGSATKTQESAIVTSISTSLLFFMFSSLITPVETLQKNIAFIIKLLPLTIFETKFRIITIFNSPLTFSSEEILATIAVVIIISLSIHVANKKNKSKII